MLPEFIQAVISIAKRSAATSLLILMGLTFAGCPTCEDTGDCPKPNPFFTYITQTWGDEDLEVIKCDTINATQFYVGFELDLARDSDSLNYYVFNFTTKFGSPAFPPSGRIYLDKDDVNSGKNTVEGRRNDGYEMQIIDISVNLSGAQNLNFIIFENADCTDDAGRTKTPKGNYIFRTKKT